jgi:Pvc16 N-terminal domain
MSNTLAIGAVTATLRRLLNRASQPLPFDPDPDADLADATCTARPPDKARSSEDTNQLNLFLYQTAYNAALRNMDLPGRTLPGESGQPSLALNLYYLLTSYGRNYDDVLGHRLLGRAMSILHDNAVLLPADIQASLPGADLFGQIERVRVSPHTLGGEELSKLWAIFQAPYRVTAAYQVAVVLIDSARRTKASLPVLSRTVTVRPTALPPYPTIDAIMMPRVAQPAARLGLAASSITGDTVRLVGHDLDGDAATASFSHRLLQTPRTVDATPTSGDALTATVPLTLPGTDPDQLAWPAGTYAVSVRITRTTPAKDATSNDAPMALAPRLVGGVPGTYARDATTGDITVPITVSPAVWPGQRVSLLIGTREIIAAGRSNKLTSLSFTISDLAPGSHPVRLRVDGIDSLVVKYSATDPPTSLDSSQAIEVT